MIKTLIKTMLSNFGYELRKKKEVGFNSAYLSKICNPKVVIDVGVGVGTYPLYEAYPDAKFILIEPLEEYRDSIEKITKQYNCDMYFKAVGESEGELEINIDPNDLTKSSFMDRTSLTETSSKLVNRSVQVTTLDVVYRDFQELGGPILLKIDTEGHELSVLKGSTELLKSVDFLVVEVSITKRFEGSYEFEDIISFLSKHGFYVFSFLTITHPNGELRPRFSDVVFKRRKE